MNAIKQEMGIPAFQGMDLTTLKAVIAELRETILPSRFEKAQQPDANTLQIGLRNLKSLIWIEISWDPEAPRIVQINSPLNTGRESTLAKQIQYGLQKMALVEIKQEGFERVIEFCLSRRPGEEVRKSLIIEIMGRHSNFCF